MPRVSVVLSEQLSDLRSRRIIYNVTVENYGERALHLRSINPRVGKQVTVSEVTTPADLAESDQVDQLCGGIEDLLRSWLAATVTDDPMPPASRRSRTRLGRSLEALAEAVADLALFAPAVALQIVRSLDRIGHLPDWARPKRSDVDHRIEQLVPSLHDYAAAALAVERFVPTREPEPDGDAAPDGDGNGKHDGRGGNENGQENGHGNGKENGKRNGRRNGRQSGRQSGRQNGRQNGKDVVPPEVAAAFEVRLAQLERLDREHDGAEPYLVELLPDSLHTQTLELDFGRGWLNVQKHTVTIEVRYAEIATPEEPGPRPSRVATETRFVEISPNPALLTCTALVGAMLGTLLRTAAAGEAGDRMDLADAWAQITSNAGIMALVLALVVFNVFEFTSLAARLTRYVNWRGALLIGVVCGLAGAKVLSALQGPLTG